MAQRLWSYSFTPPASPERLRKNVYYSDNYQENPKAMLDDDQTEPKYVLVDRGSLASVAPSVEEIREPSVPVPSFRKVAELPGNQSKVRVFHKAEVRSAGFRLSSSPSV